MSQVELLKCAYCGNIERDAFKILSKGYLCKACGGYHYYKNDDEKTQCFIGNDHIRNYRFGEAEDIFRDLLKDYPQSVSARWGLLLAKFGVVEIKGFYEREVKPIFCFQNFEVYKGMTFRSQKEYLALQELLTNEPEAWKFYEEKAAAIDKALADFKGSRNKSERDIFICVKISNATEADPYAKGRTKDFEEAYRLYEDLKAKGANVFFSFITLKNEIDADNVIWTSLLKSKKMLLVASDREYLQSVWVKSEWKRWLYLGREEELYIYSLNDKEPLEVLPIELSNLHPQIYTSESRKKLIRDITEELLKSDKARKMEVKLQKQIEEDEKIREESARKQAELENRKRKDIWRIILPIAMICSFCLLAIGVLIQKLISFPYVMPIVACVIALEGTVFSILLFERKFMNILLLLFYNMSFLGFLIAGVKIFLIFDGDLEISVNNYLFLGYILLYGIVPLLMPIMFPWLYVSDRKSE